MALVVWHVQPDGQPNPAAVRVFSVTPQYQSRTAPTAVSVDQLSVAVRVRSGMRLVRLLGATSVWRSKSSRKLHE